MKTNEMEYYNPTMSIEQEHTLLYTFQYENAFAQIVTTMGGNVSGGGVMQLDFDTGLTVPVENELTKKHVVFYDDEDVDLPFREVGELVFYYPNGAELHMDLEDASDYLVGIQIIDYTESEE